jgi:hypothetical protein
MFLNYLNACKIISGILSEGGDYNAEKSQILAEKFVFAIFNFTENFNYYF